MEATLSQKAYDQLRGQLTRGELQPGTRLVNRTLAKELGVSFTPVREAINRLASEGLVEYVRGAGAYVRRPDISELAELYDVREALEPLAAAEAAKHISRHDLEEMQSICDEWRAICRLIRQEGIGHATQEQMNVWMAGEAAFHSVLIAASGNRWLMKLADQMQVVTRMFHPHRVTPDFYTLQNAANTWRTHAALVRALAKGDAKTAAYWMTRQIQIARECVLPYLRRQERSEQAARTA